MKQYQMEELAFAGHTSPQNTWEPGITATFDDGTETVTVRGFYAGNGTYKVRFLPLKAGEYRYRISGVAQEQGILIAEPADCVHHGLPQADGTHIRFTDGTFFTPFGTTVYALAHQEPSLVEQTLQTLASSPFNKVRLCVFPKHYQYSHNEPPRYPFFTLHGKSVETAARETGPLSMVTEPLWDVMQPDPAFWDSLESVITRLGDSGIVADLILFHPYDRWGFSTLRQEECTSYLDYAIRRLGAFPNLMWSLANEYDLIPGKTLEDWYALEAFIAGHDPWHHMLSCHNCFMLYDYGRPNITHVSIQTRDPNRVIPLMMKYCKPVLIDECGYEGNLEETFGSLTGQTMTDRFWKAVTTGGYCTHGETFVNHDSPEPDQEAVFWARGGRLIGTSPARISFLRTFVDSLPGPIECSLGSGFNPLLFMPKEELNCYIDSMPPALAAIVRAIRDMGEEERLSHLTTEGEHNGHVGDQVWIRYFGSDVHGLVKMDLPADKTYTIEAIDTWNMTREVVAKNISGSCEVRIPERPWMAVAAFLEASVPDDLQTGTGGSEC